MNREQWTKAGLEIADHMKEIQKIIKRNNIDQINIPMFPDWSMATYIEEQGGEYTYWDVKVCKDGPTELSENLKPYYTRT